MSPHPSQSDPYYQALLEHHTLKTEADADRLLGWLASGKCDLKDTLYQRAAIIGYDYLLDWAAGSPDDLFLRLSALVDFWSVVRNKITALEIENQGSEVLLRGFCVSLWDRWETWSNAHRALFPSRLPFDQEIGQYLAYLIGEVFPGFSNLVEITSQPLASNWREPLAVVMKAVNQGAVECFAVEKALKDQRANKERFQKQGPKEQAEIDMLAGEIKTLEDRLAKSEKEQFALRRFFYSLLHLHNAQFGNDQTCWINEDEVRKQIKGKELAERGEASELLHWEKFIAGDFSGIDREDDRYIHFFCALYTPIRHRPAVGSLPGIEAYCQALFEKLALNPRKKRPADRAASAEKRTLGADAETLAVLLRHWATHSAFFEWFLRERVGYEFTELDAREDFAPELPSPFGCDHYIAIMGTPKVGKSYFLFASEAASRLNGRKDKKRHVTVHSGMRDVAHTGKLGNAESQRKRWRDGTPSATIEFDLVAETWVEKLLRFRFFDVPGGFFNPESKDGHRQVTDYFMSREPSAILLLMDEDVFEEDAVMEHYHKMVQIVKDIHPGRQASVPVYFVFTKADLRRKSQLGEPKAKDASEVAALQRLHGEFEAKSGVKTPWMYGCRGLQCETAEDFRDFAGNHRDISASLAVRHEILRSVDSTWELLKLCFKNGFNNITFAYTDCQHPKNRAEPKKPDGTVFPQNFASVVGLWEDVYAYVRRATVKSRQEALAGFATRAERARTNAAQFLQAYRQDISYEFDPADLQSEAGSIDDELRASRENPRVDGARTMVQIRNRFKKEEQKLDAVEEEVRQHLGLIARELGLPPLEAKIPVPERTPMGVAEDTSLPAVVRFVTEKLQADWLQQFDLWRKENKIAEDLEESSDLQKLLEKLPDYLPSRQHDYPKQPKFHPLRGCIRNLCWLESWPVDTVLGDSEEVLIRRLETADPKQREKILRVVSYKVPRYDFQHFRVWVENQPGDLAEYAAKGYDATGEEFSITFANGKKEAESMWDHRDGLIGEALSLLKLLDGVREARKDLGAMRTVKEIAFLKHLLENAGLRFEGTVREARTLVGDLETHAGTLYELRTEPMFKHADWVKRVQEEEGKFKESFPEWATDGRQHPHARSMRVQQINDVLKYLLSDRYKGAREENGVHDEATLIEPKSAIRIAKPEFRAKDYALAVTLAAQYAEAVALDRSQWLGDQELEPSTADFLEIDFQQGLYSAESASDWVARWSEFIKQVTRQVEVTTQA